MWRRKVTGRGSETARDSVCLVLASGVDNSYSLLPLSSVSSSPPHADFSVTHTYTHKHMAMLCVSRLPWGDPVFVGEMLLFAHFQARASNFHCLQKASCCFQMSSYQHLSFLLFQLREHLAKGQRTLAGEGMSQIVRSLLELLQRRSYYSGDLLFSTEILRNVTDTFKRATYIPAPDDVQVSPGSS